MFRTHATDRKPHSRRSVFAVVVSFVFALTLVSALPAPATVPDDDFSATWGVRGLMPGQVSINYRIRSMVTIDDRIYVAGRFAEVVAPDATSRDQSYIAAFDRDSGAWISSFRPIVNAPIHALAVSSDKTTLFAGGEFTTVNGASQRGLVALDPTTGLQKPGFDVSFTETGQGRANVMAIETAGSNLVIGGDWKQVNGIDQARAARVSQATGAVDTSFAPVVLGGQVLAIEVSPINGRVYLGGQFARVNGDTDLRYFAALDANGASLDQPLFDDPTIYHPSEPMNGYAILEVGGTVFVGARSNLMIVLDRNSLARKWYYGPETNAWNIDASWHGADMQALTLFEGQVYGGHHARWIGSPGTLVGNGYADSRTNRGTPSNTLSRFSTGGEHDPSFLPIELKGSVWAMTDAGDGCLWLGGNFSIPDHDDWNLTRLCDDEVSQLPHAPFGSASKFVDQQFLDFYGREPSAAETRNWLASGSSNHANAPVIVAGIVDGIYIEEGRQVIRLYTGLFGRLPDQGGLDYWRAQRGHGLSLEDMVDAFLVSPEFNNLVGTVDNREFAAEVYRRVLDREPDVAGLNYWTDVLNRGFPRRELVVHFTESEEYIAATRADVAVIVTYSSMVDRIPTNVELTQWSDAIEAAGTSLPLTEQVFSSREYANRISKLPTGKI